MTVIGLFHIGEDLFPWVRRRMDHALKAGPFGCVCKKCRPRSGRINGV